MTEFKAGEIPERSRDAAGVVFSCRGILRLTAFNAILLAALLFSSGCDQKQGVKIGDSAPGFSGLDITGEYVSLNQFKGSIVVLYFWTNSCCSDRVKQLEPLYTRKHKGLAIVAINEIDTKHDVEAYAKKNGLTFTLLTDEHATLFKQYRVLGFPTIFILDRNGVIREKILGEIQNVRLEKLIQHQFDIQKKTEAAYGKVHPR